METQPLKGRVALVTGVSRRKGIGFAVANRLAMFGADLFIHHYAPFDAQQTWGADTDGIRSILEELLAHGGRVRDLEADFYDPQSPRNTVLSAVRAFGHVDILVANHAYSTSGSLEDLTARDIDKHLTVNVRATLLLVSEYASQHDGRTGGRVIMLTSGQHEGPMSGELAYVASKAAIHGLTKSLSAHLIRRGITVNTVNPGATDTGYANEEIYNAVLAHEPQGRWGQPEDAARLIAWLATDDAAWITGQVINSTGGGP
jgi:3-oxoacyl-[acyl-carrier protein] reductase